MALTREQILEAIKTRAEETVVVHVPEWGGDILIRRMTASEAERSGLASDDAETPEKIARVLAMSVVDEDGNLAFTTKDIQALAKIDVGAAAKVFTKCIEINGLSSDELDAAVEAFAEAQPDSSSSS